MYLSFFGRDVKAGQTARAHCRLVVGQNLSDEQIVERYEQYLKERKGAARVDGESNSVELSEADDGRTMRVPTGASVVIALEGNPTTGYSWKTAKIAGDVVKEVDKIKYRARAHRPGMVGVGGTFLATLKAAKPGTTTVTLHYARPWEKDKPPEKTVSVTLRVVEAE